MDSYQEKFIREIEIRGLAPTTKNAYLKSITRLFEYCKKDPAEINLEDIKSYLYYYRHKQAAGRETKMSPRTINRDASGIAFYCKHVLGKNYYGDIPRSKAPRKAPVILTQEEITKMINGLENIFWKALVMTVYSAGLRQSEVRNLKIQDVDSKRMVLYIRNAKGAKDRQAVLYPRVLECLREYWKTYRIERNRKTKSDYLFIPNKNSYNGKLNKSLSHTAVAYIISRATKFAGIKKHVTPHSLRHAFAVHHVERGTHFRHIQYLLGHDSPRATSHYTSVADITTVSIPDLTEKMNKGVESETTQA